MKFKLRSRLALLLWAGIALSPVLAQTAQGPAQAPAAAQRSVDVWLLRLHEASRKRAYMGTFVVSSASGALSSARIWHVCDGEQQMERVDTLTGAPRSTFRHNEQVVTLLPEARVARTEQRESLGLFPSLLNSGDHAIAEFYAVREAGRDRVAGHDADVVQFVPKDKLRFGYRIWSEKKTGLVIRLQTLDTAGRVLEQAAFSELQLDVPVKMDQLAQMMASTGGYRVEKAEMLKTTAAAEGWALRNAVPGFRAMSCFKRPAPAGHPAAERTVQWIFSDGLASVSLFVEGFDRQRHTNEGTMAAGATHTLTRRVGDKDSGEWWLTVVGEAPVQTLQAFALSLERQK